MTEISQAEVKSEALSQAKIVEKGLPVYEIAFHIAPSIPEDGVAAVVEKVRATLGGAEIISERFPQKMTLAYTVERAETGKHEKFNEAYFGVVKFAVDRSAIPAIGVAIRSMRDILRFLLIETVREDISVAPRRTVFSSNRLEGETLHKPLVEAEKGGEVSDVDLNKSIEALVA